MHYTYPCLIISKSTTHYIGKAAAATGALVPASVATVMPVKSPSRSQHQHFCTIQRHSLAMPWQTSTKAPVSPPKPQCDYATWHQSRWWVCPQHNRMCILHHRISSWHPFPFPFPYLPQQKVMTGPTYWYLCCTANHDHDGLWFFLICRIWSTALPMVCQTSSKKCKPWLLWGCLPLQKPLHHMVLSHSITFSSRFGWASICTAARALRCSSRQLLYHPPHGSQIHIILVKSSSVWFTPVSHDVAYNSARAHPCSHHRLWWHRWHRWTKESSLHCTRSFGSQGARTWWRWWFIAARIHPLKTSGSGNRNLPWFTENFSNTTITVIRCRSSQTP